jgi:hypothetical protein
MVSVLVSSAVDRGLEVLSGQIKDYKMVMCCFCAKYTALNRKSKDWLIRVFSVLRFPPPVNLTINAQLWGTTTNQCLLKTVLFFKENCI